MDSREVPRTPLEASLINRIYSWLFWIWYRYFGDGKKVDWDNYDSTVAALDTPQKVQSWLFANITYRKDTKAWHHWQTAEVTFNEKEGDCEDWAVFANECLRKKYEGYFLCMYNEDSGHASYLIRKVPETWVSVGTFGFMNHRGKVPEIIKDWWGFGDWTMVTLEDEDMNFIEVYYK